MNMPVYESGGNGNDSIKEAYKKAFAENERVGRDALVELTKFLTKEGESKAGL